MPNICTLHVNGKEVWVSSYSDIDNDDYLYYGYSENRSGQYKMPYRVVLRNGEFYDRSNNKILSKFDVADIIKSE